MKASISPNDLPVFEYRGQIVTDSRDVAAMLGKRHADIMRTIDTMARHLNQRNFASVEFFTKAHYKDAKGESRPCYYLTQMGCEMVAHKQTGAQQPGVARGQDAGPGRPAAGDGRDQGICGVRQAAWEPERGFLLC